jgi:hypothetical protein
VVPVKTLETARRELEGANLFPIFRMNNPACQTNRQRAWSPGCFDAVQNRLPNRPRHVPYPTPEPSTEIGRRCLMTPEVIFIDRPAEQIHSVGTSHAQVEQPRKQDSPDRLAVEITARGRRKAASCLESREHACDPALADESRINLPRPKALHHELPRVELVKPPPRETTQHVRAELRLWHVSQEDEQRALLATFTQSLTDSEHRIALHYFDRLGRDLEVTRSTPPPVCANPEHPFVRVFRSKAHDVLANL